MLVALGMFPRLFPFTLCPLRVAASLCRNRAPGHAATRHPAPGRSIPPRRHPPARARKGARSHSTQPTGAAFHPPAHARVHARPAPAGTTGTLARLPHARACAGARAPRRPLGPLRPGPPPLASAPRTMPHRAPGRPGLKPRSPRIAGSPAQAFGGREHIFCFCHTNSWPPSGFGGTERRAAGRPARRRNWTNEEGGGPTPTYQHPGAGVRGPALPAPHLGASDAWTA